MKGLLLKDILTIYHTKNISALLILAIIPLVYDVIKGQGYFISVTMATWIISVVACYSFISDQEDGSLPYLLSLPILKKDYIKAKYILILMMTLVGFIISFLITSIVYLFIGIDPSYILSSFLDIIEIPFIFLLIEGLALPIISRIENKLARYAILFIASAYSFMQLGIRVEIALLLKDPIFSAFTLYDLIMPITAIIIYIISMMISMHLYKPKNI